MSRTFNKNFVPPRFWYIKVFLGISYKYWIATPLANGYIYSFHLISGLQVWLQLTEWIFGKWFNMLLFNWTNLILNLKNALDSLLFTNSNFSTRTFHTKLHWLLIWDSWCLYLQNLRISISCRSCSFKWRSLDRGILSCHTCRGNKLKPCESIIDQIRDSDFYLIIKLLPVYSNAIIKFCQNL